MVDKSSGLRTVEYISTAKRDYQDADLHALLDRALSFNLEAGVTGLLLFANGVFLQTFEGAHDRVQEVFNRIERDPTHSIQRVITDETIERRVYPEWAMMANFTALNPPIVDHLQSLEGAQFTASQIAAIGRAVAFLKSGDATDLDA